MKDRDDYPTDIATGYQMELAVQEAKCIVRRARDLQLTLFPTLSKVESKCNNQDRHSTARRDHTYGVFRHSNLLRKQVTETKLNHLVVKLCSDGFDLIVKCNDGSGADGQIMHSTYDDYPFLICIDNAKLTSFLLHVLSLIPYNLLYNRGVVVEIRDQRLSNECEPRFVLFEHTNESVIQYTRMRMNRPSVNNKSFNCLEADVLLQVSGHLCLVNNPVVSIVSNYLQHDHNALANLAKHHREQRKRESTKEKNRGKGNNISTLDNTTLLDFIVSRKRRSSDKEETITSKSPKIDDESAELAITKKEKPDLPLKEISKFMADHIPFSPMLYTAQAEKNISNKSKLCLELYTQKVLREKYEMELFSDDFPKVEKIIKTAEVKITKVPVQEQYYGEISVYFEGREQVNKGPEFLLGSKERAEKFINNYIRAFTEGDTKIVRIRHVLPNLEVIITCTEKMRVLSHQRTH